MSYSGSCTKITDWSSTQFETPEGKKKKKTCFVPKYLTGKVSFLSGSTIQRSQLLSVDHLIQCYPVVISYQEKCTCGLQKDPKIILITNVVDAQKT